MNVQATDWYAGLAWEPTRLDPDVLPDVLIQWDQQARRRRLPAVDLMRPGLSPIDIATRLISHGAPTHPDLISWWSWHDGVQPGTSGPSHYSWNLYLFSLDEAVSKWRQFEKDLEWDEDYPCGVLPHYVPFMESSSRGFLLDTVTREVAYYSPEFGHEDWHRWPNMATVLHPFVANLALGKDWPPDSPGNHTPDPDYQPDSINP